jgi:Predicted membrane protein (DUF2142)
VKNSAARSAAFVGAALFSLMVVWSFITPLFSGPDEPSNFIRSAAVIRGEWVGENYPASIEKSYWSTYVDIDPQFGTANAIPWCFAPFPEKPGCGIAVEDAPVVDIPTWTNMGRYPPLPFFVSGVGTLFGATDLSVRLARLMTSAVCSGLLACAAYSLVASRRSLIGLLLAVTPGTVFLASAMNPSAIEICAAIAMWVIVPQLLQGSTPNRLTKVAFLVAGSALIASRPLGIVMYLVVVAISWLAFGSRDVGRFFRQNRITLAIHTFITSFMAWWYVVVYSFQTSPSLTEGIELLPMTKRFSTAVQHMPELLEHIVGNFGWLDTPIPRGALLLYCIALGPTLLLCAMNWNLRIAVVLSVHVALSIAIAVAVDINFYAMFGWFGAQGRHFAPVLVGVPIVAMYKHSFSKRLNSAVISVWAIAMMWSGLGALRRYTVGIQENNAFDMFSNRVWNPALGFWVSVVLLIATTVAVAVAFVGSQRAQIAR